MNDVARDTLCIFCENVCASMCSGISIHADCIRNFGWYNAVNTITISTFRRTTDHKYIHISIPFFTAVSKSKHEDTQNNMYFNPKGNFLFINVNACVHSSNTGHMLFIFYNSTQIVIFKLQFKIIDNFKNIQIYWENMQKTKEVDN